MARSHDLDQIDPIDAAYSRVAKQERGRLRAGRDARAPWDAEVQHMLYKSNGPGTYRSGIGEMNRSIWILCDMRHKVKAMMKALHRG